MDGVDYLPNDVVLAGVPLCATMKKAEIEFAATDWVLIPIRDLGPRVGRDGDMMINGCGLCPTLADLAATDWEKDNE